MIDFQEQCIRNQEKVAAAALAAAAAQAVQKLNTNNLTNNRLQAGISSIPNGIISRTGTLYESRSSISSPYGSGSSLNRTSSIRRASLRNSERTKKLNENFLDVLQHKDKIEEDVDEHTTNGVHTNGIIPSKITNKEEHLTNSAVTTDPTIREQVTITPMKKPRNTSAVELPLAPLRVPLPLPPQTTADTLSDVKKRREERRRVLNSGPPSSTIPPSAIVTSPPRPVIDINDRTSTKMSNGNHLSTIKDPIENYSSEKYSEIHGYVSDNNHEKRICCTIL
jgi:hypothetical protein